MSRTSGSRIPALRSSLALVVGFFAASSLLATTGCDGRPASKKKKDSAQKAEPKKAAEAKKGEDDKPAKVADADKKEGEAAKDDTPCGKYEKSLCEVAGEQSPTCMSFKSLAKYLPPAACTAGLSNIDFTKGKIAEGKKVCDELITKLCADVGEKTDSCKMVKERVPGFPADRCQAMMDNYDKVVEDLKKTEEANKPLDAAKQAKIAAAGAPSFGPADAKVTLVEFSDFECPFCTRAANALDEVKKNFKDKVRIVFRQFPLSFHKNAHLASQAALAAHEQGKFWEYHDKLFENQKNLTRADLDKYAKELKLNMKKFKKALASGKYKKQVDDDLALGKEVAVRGTPTMFLNGARVKNAADYNALKAEIEEALK